MPPFCAIPPLDQAGTRIGRGYGIGYNRDRSVRDQLHGGMDFVADSGTPILAPAPGTVVLISHDSGSGRVRGMGGYGNAVVLEHRFAIPGLPNPFWTLYAHMRDVPAAALGQTVNIGTLLGLVGNTTNGQFRTMGAHLHHELRRRAFPGSYDHDTVDPSILYRGLGIDYIGSRTEVSRQVGGQLLVRQGGQSDCRAGQVPSFAGLGFRGLGEAPPGYVDPATLRAKYAPYGVSRSNQNVESVLPPDYAAMLIANDNTRPRSSGSSSGGLLLGAGVVLLGAALLFKR